LYAKNGKNLLVNIYICTGINSANTGGEKRCVLHCECWGGVEFFDLMRVAYFDAKGRNLTGNFKAFLD